MCILRFVEEIFPFVSYFVRSYRQRRRSQSTEILSKKEFADYINITEAKVKERLDEEHQRALTINEKTSKFTISFSMALTFVGATIAFLKTIILPEATQMMLSVLINLLIFLGLFYCIMAGLVALGALRTAPRYGYGTSLLLEQNTRRKEILAESLARQEVINIVPHLRNEAAFQSLRNGLLLFVVVIVIFAVTLAHQFFSIFSSKIC